MQKVKDAINSLDVDPTLLAYIFVDKNPAVQRQMFNVCIALIHSWASEYEGGVIEDYALDSRRLRDTIDAFQIGE